MATEKTKPGTPDQAGQDIQEQKSKTAPQEGASTQKTPSGDGDADQGETGAATPPDTPVLKNLDELALSFRVPTWQQAALVQFMGWAPDKSVSEADYADALDALNSRRMGSGRKE